MDEEKKDFNLDEPIIEDIDFSDCDDKGYNLCVPIDKILDKVKIGNLEIDVIDLDFDPKILEGLEYWLILKYDKNGE